MRHFNLEAIAIRLYGFYVDSLESLTAPAFEASGGIVDGKSSNRMNVVRGSDAHNQTSQWPVDHTHAIDVTRANRKISPQTGNSVSAWM